MNRNAPSDHSLLIALFALFILCSPLNQWWSAMRLPWYMLFAPWLLIIILIALNQKRQRRGD